MFQGTTGGFQGDESVLHGKSSSDPVMAYVTFCIDPIVGGRFIQDHISCWKSNLRISHLDSS